MSRPTCTVLFVAFFSLALSTLYCQATEQHADQPNSQPSQRLYGYIQPAALQFVNSRQVRIPAADARLPFDLEMLAQQPLVKRERTLSHEWSSCEFSPMSCLLRRRRAAI